ncbi:MAG: phosphatidylinositol-specific phospholipase C1-like protein [Bryobacterales bacterium]|nr:phosphatidylinositol-specific phospholipase C1-like protein [Acidobacteriota bacterium]MCB9383308.1 phosphatidylinositol-specific phospholipase C1-like protein [Bryobacterales bacterium]
MRFVLLLLSLLSVASAEDPADRFRINQIQVLGTHNSYKESIDPSLWQLLTKGERAGRLKGLEYQHRPMEEQLDRGMRKLEIDVLHDPQGGRYAHPLGLRMVADAGLPAGPAYDPDGLMQKPGLKVLHVQDIDFRTRYYTFRRALEELKAWSDAHPRHVPIAILMNAKTGSVPIEGSVQALPFDRAAFDAWDAEIRAVLPPQKLLTPDDVRGDFSTLEQAVLAHAWPRLGDVRGRFLFILDETGEKLETYVRGHPSLVGRVMFVNAREGRPEAAFRVVNDAIGDFHYIEKLVRDGYMVRTRADADTREARTGSYDRSKAAFAGGAQYVSTDYFEPNPAFGTGYKVALPGGGPARWNPLLAPPVDGLAAPE